MKVNIDNLDVEMLLGNNGVTFAVHQNDDTYLGKLRIGTGTVNGVVVEPVSGTE
jgi:hypothetical protein